MRGLHFQEAYQGYVFSQAVTPLGLAIPIYTATAIGGAGINAQPLWNPPGSGVLVELISIDIDYASGTADYGALLVMGVPLSAVATGAVCTAFAETTPQNAYLGAGGASKVKSNNGAGTTTVTAGTAGAPAAAAPGVLRSIGRINLEAQTGTAGTTSGFTYTFNGTLLVPPGYMTYFAATKASVALYATTLVWKEIPLV